MSDVEHLDAVLRAFAKSDLGQRLLRRGAASIGVVDMRHAFGLHSRATLRPTRRLGLVSELKRRYGQNQHEASPMGLVFRNATAGPVAASIAMAASGPFEAAMSATTTNEPPRPTGATEPRLDPQTESSTATLWPTGATEPRFDPQTESASATLYRVKRPKASQDAGEAAAASVPMGGMVTLEPPASPRGTQSSSAPVAPMDAQVEERRPPSVSPESPAPVRAADSAVTGRVAPEPSATAPPRASGEADSQPQGSLSARPSPLVFARREIIAPQAARNDQQPAKPVASSATTPTPHPPARTLTEPGSVSPTTPASREGERQLSPRLNFAPQPAQGSDPASGPPPLYVANASARTPSDRLAQSHVPVSAEIRPSQAASASPAIVWRKPHHEREGREVMPQTPIAAFASTDGGQTRFVAADGKAGFGERAASPTTRFADGGAVDVAHIAREVSRTIARQLRVDRERRGRTR